MYKTAYRNASALADAIRSGEYTPESAPKPTPVSSNSLMQRKKPAAEPIAKPSAQEDMASMLALMRETEAYLAETEGTGVSNSLRPHSRGEAGLHVSKNAPLSKAEVVAYMKTKGVPEHVASGLAWNMIDESGLVPGINEHNPTVEGSRGGFGYFQHTGDRRVALENYLTERGLDLDDPYGQIDFTFDVELAGPERKALERALATKTEEEAAAVWVADFFRPAEEHREARIAKYMRGLQ